MPDLSTDPRLKPPTTTPSPGARFGSADRSLGAYLWYRVVQGFIATLMTTLCGLRASGRENVPRTGPLLLVSNHLSNLDVLVLAILLDRPLNFMARSTLFFWPLGPLIRSLGAFPINRDGMGAEGFKETLRRIRSGGIVTLFPEGTRTADGDLSDLKPGIARLVQKSRVPIIPTAIAGTFESWPKTRLIPRLYPLRVHYGSPIPPDLAASLDPEALTTLIRARILECQAIARHGLARDRAVEF